jgi:hypothetical protein
MISPRQFLIAVTIAFFGSAASAAENCATVLAAPPAVLQRPLVVLGELHGTAQTVALAGDLVCAKAIRGEEVILALEVPDSEQARLYAFLESHGTQGDVDALLSGDFWMRPAQRQDGRSSVAMAQLLERIRALRHEGLRIHVAAIDGAQAGLKRDAVMARNLRNLMRARPMAPVVALVGNVHALAYRGAFFDPDYESFAFLLADLDPLTLNVVPKRGAAWVCVPECGTKKVWEQPALLATEPGFHLGEEKDKPPRYHGTVVLERADASLPAKAN